MKNSKVILIITVVIILLGLFIFSIYKYISLNEKLNNHINVIVTGTYKIEKQDKTESVALSDNENIFSYYDDRYNIIEQGNINKIEENIYEFIGSDSQVYCRAVFTYGKMYMIKEDNITIFDKKIDTMALPD